MPLQQPQIKSNPSQVSAPMKTTSTFEGKDYQTVPSSVLFQQNIPPLAAAIVDIIKPWVSPSSIFNQSFSIWRSLLARTPISPGPRITDGAGNLSSANWTVPKTNDIFKEVRKRWTSRIFQLNLHLSSPRLGLTIKQIHSLVMMMCCLSCTTDNSASLITTLILPLFLFQPFRLDLMHKLLALSEDPDTNIALLLKDGIPSGAFTPLQSVSLWDPNHKPQEEPELQICHKIGPVQVEKIIGILLWATSLVHHVRFLLTSLYRDLFAIPATNYSIRPTLREHFLDILTDDAIISRNNDLHLHLPVGTKVTEFRHSSVTSETKLPNDVPIEKHVWVRIRDPNTDKRKLSKEPKATVLWILDSLLPLLSTMPLNRFCNLNIQAAADAFAADDTMGIAGWVPIQSSTFWLSETWARLHVLLYTRTFRDTSHRGKLWPNYAPYSLFTKNVNHVQD